ncbi:hypothetical protein SAMN04515674_10646 [Pseudarcicella hirudinis]|uniref:Uncharacterized protein n=1 Tax=Pseudarcicella hirudinis TaxID=1079859 RepID=A0A1I5THG0_9BACT|nr:hypothetical protein [Pseudarcicella hirudinis]SFP82291.1 hypothetical protein SAMN04515674_10646 [Pseudarcicella hirudinis]
MANQKGLISEKEVSELTDALSVVELEERFEMTAAAASSERCTITQAEAA